MVILLDFKLNNWFNTALNEWTEYHFSLSKSKSFTKNVTIWHLYYLKVITSVGSALAQFDDDNRIPVYGFGDANTTNKSVFPFNKKVWYKIMPFY